MAETATLARPYAGAAFDIAREADRLDQWSRQLASLAAAAEVDEVQEFIASPSLPGPAKAQRIIDLLGDELGTDARRFVHVLADNKRLDIMGEIAEQFEALKAAAERTLDVEIISAVELSESQLAGFVQGLTQRFGQFIGAALGREAKANGDPIPVRGGLDPESSTRVAQAEIRMGDQEGTHALLERRLFLAAHAGLPISWKPQLSNFDPFNAIATQATRGNRRPSHRDRQGARPARRSSAPCRGTLATGCQSIGTAPMA